MTDTVFCIKMQGIFTLFYGAFPLDTRVLVNGLASVSSEIEARKLHLRERDNINRHEVLTATEFKGTVSKYAATTTPQ